MYHFHTEYKTAFSQYNNHDDNYLVEMAKENSEEYFIIRYYELS